MVFMTRLSFSMSVTRARRLSLTKLSTVPTARATELSAAWSSWRSVTRLLETPARSATNARTSSSLRASVSVKIASCSTVSNRSPLPSPKVVAASERLRSIWLPRAPLPSSAFAPARRVRSRVPSALTPLGPSAEVRSRSAA